MARKIQDAAEAAQSPEAQPAGGVYFVKNQTNEIIKFDDGTTHKFERSKTYVDNPDLIEKLRKVAALPGNPYRIFEALG